MQSAWVGVWLRCKSFLQLLEPGARSRTGGELTGSKWRNGSAPCREPGPWEKSQRELEVFSRRLLGLTVVRTTQHAEENHLAQMYSFSSLSLVSFARPALLLDKEFVHFDIVSPWVRMEGRVGRRALKGHCCNKQRNCV